MAFGVTAWEPWVYGHRLYPLRSFPSAGALQSVEIYLWARLVRGLEKGIYKHSFTRHALEVISRGNFEGEIIRISLGQDHAAGGSGSVILSAKRVRSSWKYGARGYKYSLLDTGMAAKNFYIASTAVGLGTCAIGAFYEEELCRPVRANCETEIPPHNALRTPEKTDPRSPKSRPELGRSRVALAPSLALLPNCAYMCIHMHTLVEKPERLYKILDEYVEELFTNPRKNF